VPKTKTAAISPAERAALVADVVALIEAGRGAAARSLNAVITTTYWLVGRTIVEREQGGAHRAEYGGAVLEHLAERLTARYGRGFSRRNLDDMRRFYLAWRIGEPATHGAGVLPARPPIRQTLSAKSIRRTASAKSEAPTFPLPWSHYVRLLSVKNANARTFYEAEALRGGWTIRQLARQVGTQFYERTALSKNKEAMLAKGTKATPEDTVTAEEELKDPLVLEFLDLKDEYSESEIEEALVLRLEHFLLELGGDFAFVGRQRRLRVGNAWYRVDLLFFHRALRCLVVVDLEIGAFTHADAGQMHLYLNYAREHWTRPDQNPPVGLILCAEKDEAVARYALDGLPNKILAAEYMTKLPDEKVLVAELERTQRLLARRAGED
jgi:predicted nuclease of restriction endonuclease-like (RecB) superfamily